MKLFGALFLLFLCAGCSGVSWPPEFTEKIIKTPAFSIQTFIKETDANDVFIIYIEGDGNAFDAAGRPTNNPTPRGHFVRMNAIKNNYSNVAYVARPCQFIKDDLCNEKYWTSNRFSWEVIDSIASAIQEIADGRPVVLIGFSGGAQIAGLVSVLYPEFDVQELITYAGNLDHASWTDYHNMSPLDGSLNLKDFQDVYLTFPSKHYVAQNDTVIPPFLVQNFIMGKKEIIIIPDVNHNFK